MKLLKKNFFRIVVIVLLTCGLLYSYFNVLYSHFMSSTRQREIEKITAPMLSNLEKAERLECKSTIFIKTEEEEMQDPSGSMRMVHDFKHHLMELVKGNVTEILEYKGDIPILYTKGISPVYIKKNAELKKVPEDKWFRYPCEEMYGSRQKEGKSEMISYGYLASKEGIIDVESEGKEEIDGKSWSKYTATIRNTIRHMKGSQEGNSLFRKTLGEYGVDSIELRNSYPEVYKRLKGIYDQETEELTFWVDEADRITRIEKDYTFPYYMNILKENSERIEEQVGRYGYPRIISRQDYEYDPTCSIVDIPKDYKEL